MASMDSYYIPLEDLRIHLEPLNQDHIKLMRRLSNQPDIWTWYTEDLSDPDALEKWMMSRLQESETKQKMSYAVILNETGDVIGSTSYGNIHWSEKGIEIGWTWLGKDYIGAGINKHMKYLMLHHAFENMGIERLELRTDERNARSRRAMEKIGAKYDGTLRNHRSTQGGRRNTVIYSIIKSEWPEVRSTIFSEF